LRGRLLGLSNSISIEVTIPDSVDTALVTKIGVACYPHGGVEDEPMDVAEALQWAFNSPWGVGQLADLGVQWNAQAQ
jgi:hypothetical protein